MLDWHFFETPGVTYTTHARLQVDEGNNVILSYNSVEQLPDGVNTAHALHLAKFSPGLGTIYSQTLHPSPYGPIDIPVAIYLGEGLSLFAGTSSAPNSYSPDGYLAVVNTGAVTSVRDPVPTAELLLSPNPTNGIFWLETTEPASTDRPVELIDAQGKIVQRLLLPAGAGIRQPVDIRALPQGLYFLRYRNEQGGVGLARVVKS